MIEKCSRLMHETGLKLLSAGVVVLLCGLSPMHAGNEPSKPKDPVQKIAAICMINPQTKRTDFTDNRVFADLLLKAFEEYATFVTDWEDWRPAVKAYHEAFEELKKRLQGEWRRVFGDGPSRFPWNGHSDGATDLWREDDLRRDMPVVLSLWDSGHICRTKVRYKCPLEGEFHVPNDNKAYVPKNVPAYSNQVVIDKGKDKYKAYVLKFFNASKLSKCKKYLEKFFCAPVSQLLVSGSVRLKEAGGRDCREDLQLLLNLYADYYSLDAVGVYDNRENGSDVFALVPPMACRDEFVKTTQCMVDLTVACYSNYKQWSPDDQKWLCSLLDNLDANYYVKESLHTYCIQSHDLLRGYSNASVKPCIQGYGAYTTYDGSISSVRCKGLMDVFKKLGNPLPETTWQKFVNYAGRRWSLVRETSSWGLTREIMRFVPACGPNDANTVWHRSKTFEQVPCVSLEEMKVKK